MAKRLGLPAAQADRLVVRLQLDAALDLLNGALRRRRATVRLDYRGKVAVASLELPDAPAEPILSTQPGQRIAYHWTPLDPTLSGLHFEITDGLAKMGAKLFLVIQKSKDGARYAKLQMFFNDSRLVAVTLMETKRNTFNFDSEFTL